MSPQWSGVCDGDPWKLEVDTDCFSASEPFVVSMFIVNGEMDRETGLAALSAAQARELAAELLVQADNVDANEARVAAWYAIHPEVKRPGE